MIETERSYYQKEEERTNTSDVLPLLPYINKNKIAQVEQEQPERDSVVNGNVIGSSGCYIMETNCVDR